MSAKRKSTGKRLRFEIFKRDSFTCQYCGKQPPDVVLVIDHVVPVCEGGDNDEMNLVTACEACNQGKAGKTLEARISPRPDADLEWLSVQQEIVELRRYHLAKQERDRIYGEIIENLACMFEEVSHFTWKPDYIRTEITKMIGFHSLDHIEKALRVTAVRVNNNTVGRYEWPRYVYGVLRNLEKQEE
jgi:hypothetical protein